MKTRFLLLALALLSSELHSQHHRIVVKDHSTGLPISNVHVICLDLQRVYFSAIDGGIEFTKLDSGNTFKFSHLGYESVFLNREEVFTLSELMMKRQPRQMNPVVISGEAVDAQTLIRQTYKMYKARERTDDLIFRGYYKESVLNSSRDSLECVFIGTGYDNQQKSRVTNFLDAPGSFAFEGIRKATLSKMPSYINGLNWLYGLSQPRHSLSPIRRWSDAVIDSITMNGESLVYWIHSEKPEYKQIVISDRKELLRLTEHGPFPKVLVFDPSISLDYPIYSLAGVPEKVFEKTGNTQSACTFEMYFMERLDKYDFESEQIVKEHKISDEVHKNMWNQTPIDLDFDWTPYEGLRPPR